MERWIHILLIVVVVVVTAAVVDVVTLACGLRVISSLVLLLRLSLSPPELDRVRAQ